MDQDPQLAILREQLEIIARNKQAAFSGVYLTLLGVIGSVAIGLVAARLRQKVFVDPTALGLDEVVTIFLAIATLLTIITVIAGYALTICYYYWEVDNRDVVRPMLLGVTLCLMSSAVDSPQAWLLLAALVGFSAWWAFSNTYAKIQCGKVPAIASLDQIQAMRDMSRKFVQDELDHLRRSRSACCGAGLILAISFFAGFGWTIPAWVMIAMSVLVIGVCGYLLSSEYRETFNRRNIFFSQIQKQVPQ